MAFSRRTLSLLRLKQTALITTRSIKERFGQPRRLRKAAGLLDLEMGFLPLRPGDSVDNGRYAISAMLGQGQYATVWLAMDTETDCPVALKVLSRYCYGYGQDIMELEIMQKIATVSQSSHHPGREHVAQLKRDFRHRTTEGHEHVVMVFDIMATTLEPTARSFPDRRIPVGICREVAKQMLLALDFLHTECGVIHSDLHNANIMSEFPRGCGDLPSAYGVQVMAKFLKVASEKAISAEDGFHLRLIDFGISSFRDKHLHETRIQPVCLRAPEVTLQAPWDEKIDIWNLGALVFEHVLGERMFPGIAAGDGSYSAEDDRLAKLAEAFGENGMFPSDLLRTCARGSEIFDVEEGGLLRIQKVVSTPLEWVVDSGPGGHPSQQLPATMAKEEVSVFCDFLRQMLKLNPSERKTAKQMLGHQWLGRRTDYRGSARYYRCSHGAQSVMNS